jgi:predicted RNA binding protein YcfA (HicA-like mRNA interferase family)
MAERVMGSSVMAPKTIETNSRKIVQRLKADGWMLVKVEGSHHKFAHADFAFPIVVPHPRKDLPLGTARAIAKAARWI